MTVHEKDLTAKGYVISGYFSNTDKFEDDLKTRQVLFIWSAVRKAGELARMSDLHCVEASLHIIQNHDRMKGSGVAVIIHLDISTIFKDNAVYTFQP